MKFRVQMDIHIHTLGDVSCTSSTYLFAAGVESERADDDPASLCQVGLKATELCAQLGHLSLEGVSGKVVLAGKPVCHTAQLGQVVVHGLRQGERENGEMRGGDTTHNTHARTKTRRGQEKEERKERVHRSE